MAQRARDKVKRPASRLKAPAEPAEGSADARVKALEQECARLKNELDAAHRRIAVLEESRSQVAARIDGVIESLSGVVDRGD